MRLAIISFEYAGTAAGGGIGTYVRNAAAMLSARGHDVEVFCGAADGPVGDGTVRVYPVGASAETFAAAVVPVFAARHAEAPFDVVEGPEYHADAAQVAAAFPDLPLVVKLHTPSCLIRAMDLTELTWARKARFMLGGLRHGRIATPYWRYDPTTDPERTHALAADEVVAPSRAMQQRIQALWGLAPERIALIPNVYDADPRLLALDPQTRTDRVLFLGRVEARKGVVTLARAVPLILRAFPQARFRIVGRPLPDPVTGEDLPARMRRIMGPAASAVEFTGPAPYDEIPRHFAESDICVLPSDWEASGYACQEAMAAARGVVASAAGGMAEFLDGGRHGVLAPPRDPRALAAAVVELLRSPEKRMALGRSAREHVVSAYGAQAIAPLQEASYRRAIQRRADKRRAA